MEYASIPWSLKDSTVVPKGKQKGKEQKSLTFNLAVWFLHVLAASESEPDWAYNQLKSADLQLHECQFPQVPPTPESEQKQDQKLARGAALRRSGSRKRSREDAEESYTHSFTSDGFPFTSSFQVQPLTLSFLFFLSTIFVKIAVGHLLIGHSKSRRSLRSESAPTDTTYHDDRPRWALNGDSTTSIEQGDSFTSSKNHQETEHVEPRRSKRVRAEGFKL